MLFCCQSLDGHLFHVGSTAVPLNFVIILCKHFTNESTSFEAQHEKIFREEYCFIPFSSENAGSLLVAIQIY